MTSLTGHLLIAMPQMDDPYFFRSVVFLFAHEADTGAMGIIVNKTVDLTLDQLFAHLEIEPRAKPGPAQPVHFGGPVNLETGFVLHGTGYREEGTVGIGDDFALTATFDILTAMAAGTGPSQSLLALGYAGWGPGQLEAEIQANGWLSVPADLGIVFEVDDGSKWQRALAKLGISPDMLTSGIGHA